ncbi:MAG: class I SAM-dependent methyltransferase [Pseudomonadota bacterium]
MPADPTLSPAISAMLARLHAAAAEDGARWSSEAGAVARAATDLVRMGEFYLSLSPTAGAQICRLAIDAGARHIVEFGASFGISTLYLAAAAQATDGHVTTTEVHPEKCAALRESFAEARVGDRVTLLEGDARETLKTVHGPIDFLFLDGWKRMYLPVFSLLRARLAPGATVVADNCSQPELGDYMAAIQDPASGFATEISGDMAISRRG